LDPAWFLRCSRGKIGEEKSVAIAEKKRRFKTHFRDRDPGSEKGWRLPRVAKFKTIGEAKRIFEAVPEF